MKLDAFVELTTGSILAIVVCTVFALILSAKILKNIITIFKDAEADEEMLVIENFISAFITTVLISIVYVNFVY